MRLMQGDCLELFKEIPEGSVDMILADPPYGTTRCKWDSIIPLDAMWGGAKRVCKRDAAIVIFGSEPFSSKLRCSNLNAFKYDWIWEKPQGANFMSCRFQPYRVHEIISVFCDGRCNYFPQMTTGTPYVSGKGNSGEITACYKKIQTHNNGTRYPRSIQYFKNDKRNNVHPTQKPVELLEYLIRTYTNVGDTVLDFCMGSGSTGVACANTGRDFIGIELDEKYFEIAKRRIEESCST